MNATLKRCPFCGGTAKILPFFHEHEDKFFAQCSFCGNRTKPCNSPQEARKAWNKRYYVN